VIRESDKTIQKEIPDTALSGLQKGAELGLLEDRAQ